MSTKVSFYEDVTDTKGNEEPLPDIVRDIQNGRWKKRIEWLRNIKGEADRKKFKNSLPCFTGAGLFGERNEKGLLEHSGRIIIDFDKLQNIEEIRQKLINDPYTEYLFSSCSATGLAVVIKIDGNRHRESFEFLEKYYKEKYALKIDTACKDVPRLRFVSYDPNLYVNEKSQSVTLPDAIKEKQITTTNLPSVGSERNKEIMQSIIKSGILLGNDTYESWLKIGFALSHEFGEAGRAYFHELSKISPKYDTAECDSKFDNCIRTNKGDVTFATIIHMGREAGANLTQNISKKAGFALTKLSDLFQEPEETTTWLVDGLLPSGGFSIMAAKPKVGKSTTARNLALNIARNEPVLGRNVSQGAVIYLALEEKRSEVKKHFRAMGAVGNENIHIYTGGAPVDAIKQITLVVESLKPVLLIIDPLFRLVKLKDGNDYIQVTNALEPLLRLARDSGTHVLCVHHSPKGERNPEDCVLGSQAIFGSVDTLMIMKRHENYRTLQTIQRYGEDLEETVLNYDKGGGRVTIGHTRQGQDTNCMEELIVDFLSKQNEPVTEKAINEEVEGRTTLKRNTLRELIKQDEIVRVGKGGKGDPYKYSCSQLGNESGNNKNNKENHQEKNACSLVPSIGQEQQNNNINIAETPGGCSDDSCSHVPVFPEVKKKLREQAFLTEKEGENLLGEPIDLDMLEVEL